MSMDVDPVRLSASRATPAATGPEPLGTISTGMVSVSDAIAGFSPSYRCPATRGLGHRVSAADLLAVIYGLDSAPLKLGLALFPKRRGGFQVVGGSHADVLRHQREIHNLIYAVPDVLIDGNL